MNKVTVIAEIGVNHDGDMRKAKRLVMGAKLAGADIVVRTFQQIAWLQSQQRAKISKGLDKAGSQHELLQILN